ncbi:hypothetical protein [Synechococcus sp. M16CYN]|uniref:hypothetical protein n=1 Tax=Synechococcus sp. M16CYN TaxID=3103139 RepID=UPI0032556E52
MSLRCLQRKLIWPEHVSVSQLRAWVRSELTRDGEPLRWAITCLTTAADGTRLLQLEGVYDG